MPGGVVRQDQHRRLATLHEVTRDRDHEVRVVAEHPGQEAVCRVLRDVGASLDQWCGPACFLTVVQSVRQLGPESDRLRWHRCDDAIWRALYEIPDKGARNAEAEDHEPVDP